MSWIQSIDYARSTGKLRKLYDRIKGPDGYIDNILQVHGLRPHTLEGHMALYKNVLHHRENTLPKWLLETIGTYVSLLNDCSYCVDHHTAGLRKLLDDDPRVDAILEALKHQRLKEVFDARERAILDYTKRLTLHPNTIIREHIDELRNLGLEDGEILEINQVASYFAYANRTVLGLGVSTKGDVLGLSPGNANDAGDWSHR